MGRSRNAWSFGLTVFLSSLLFVVVLRGAAPALEDANWQNILQHIQGMIRSSEGEVRGFDAKLEAHAREFAAQLAGMEKNKGQMMLWFGGSFNPDNLRYLLAGIRGQKAKAETLFAWFANAEREISDYANKVEELEAEIRSQSIGVPEAHYHEELDRNLADITSLKTQLEEVRLTIQKSGEAYSTFLSHLDEAQESTNRKADSYWTIFYLKQLPTLFSREAWEDLRKNVHQAANEYSLWWTALTGREEADWFQGLVLKSLLLVLVMGIAGWLIAGKAETVFLPDSHLTGLMPAWLLFWCWAAITWFGRYASFVFIPILFCAAEIIIASSFVCTYRFFRRHSGKEHVSGILPLWSMLCVSLVLRTLGNSYGIALVAWLLSLGICFLCMFGKKLPGTDRPQRFSFMVTKYLLPVLAGLAVLGFLPATLLIVSVVFYILVTGEIGINLVQRLRTMENRAKEKETHAFSAGVLSGLGSPAVILSLAYLNLWFLSLHVGGESILDHILSMEMRWQDYHISVKKFALVVIGFFITKAVVFIVEFFSARYQEEMDTAVLEALRTAAKYLLWGLFVLGVLSLLGFNLMSLTVVAGGLSVGIGFGLQHIVNNLLSGLILLLGRSLQSGDTIQVGETLGVVRKVTIRNTIVQTRDNATLFVPNSELITNKLVNWSHRDKRVRLKVEVGVAYGTDTEKVKRLLYRAAVSLPSVLSSPGPDVLFSNFGASTLDFTLRFWIDDVDNDSHVLSDIRSAINRIFNENGIEIAFPQSAVHIQTAPALEKLLDRVRGTELPGVFETGEATPKKSPIK